MGHYDDCYEYDEKSRVAKTKPMNKLQKFSKQELLDELKRREEENKPPPQKDNPDFSMLKHSFNIELEDLISGENNTAKFEENVLDAVFAALYGNSRLFWEWCSKQGYFADDRY